MWVRRTRAHRLQELTNSRLPFPLLCGRHKNLEWPGLHGEHVSSGHGLEEIAEIALSLSINAFSRREKQPVLSLPLHPSEDEDCVASLARLDEQGKIIRVFCNGKHGGERLISRSSACVLTGAIDAEDPRGKTPTLTGLDRGRGRRNPLQHLGHLVWPQKSRLLNLPTH